MNNIVQIKKLKDNAIIPTRGTAESAGYDLYAAIDEPITIEPHNTVKVGTGLAIQIIDNFPCFAAVFARSGLSTKQGLRPANCVGIIDYDYRGEIIVALHNDSESPKTIQPQDRVAQLVFMPYLDIQFEERKELNETGRSDKGFGSTGK